MAFKVNYGFQKAERDRLKREKKEAKARERTSARPLSPEDAINDATPGATTDADPESDPAAAERSGAESSH